MSHWEAPGKSDHWYTPKHVFEALACDGFDMDVAAPMLIPAYIGAREWIWEGSLEKEWKGFIWMNPPFGGRNALQPWLDKFFAHGNGIALVPDRTSAPWFWDAWQKADAVLFTRKLKFLRPNGEVGKSPSNGTALMAAGDKGVTALMRAQLNGLGILATPQR